MKISLAKVKQNKLYNTHVVCVWAFEEKIHNFKIIF